MTNRFVLVVAATLTFASFGCGGDDGGGEGGSGGAIAGTGGAGSGGGGSGGDPLLVNRGEINLDCPGPGPHDGEGAPRGACCHRASNIAREEMLGPNDDGAITYRVQSTLTVNHPLTIGEMTLEGVSLMRSDNEEQDLLWSFGGQRENGEEVAGEGYIQIGSGRYNCDGTYSYFGENAAPKRGIPGRDDPARWAPTRVKGQVDPTKTGRARITTQFADQMGQRQLAYTPFLNSADLSLGFELATMGYDIDEIATEGEARDCIGSRESGVWKSGGTFHLYTPIEPNSYEGITLLNGEKYCQLVAFGINPMAPDCLGERCMPGTDGCEWKKLPDSLCPTTPEEQALWGCHIGYENNPDTAEYPNHSTANCTQEAPTGPVDLAAGEKAQCCDPLGKSATLPACNAYLLIQSYVAAAAAITEEKADKTFEKCAD